MRWNRFVGNLSQTVRDGGFARTDSGRLAWRGERERHRRSAESERARGPGGHRSRHPLAGSDSLSRRHRHCGARRFALAVGAVERRRRRRSRGCPHRHDHAFPRRRAPAARLHPGHRRGELQYSRPHDGGVAALRCRKSPGRGRRRKLGDPRHHGEVPASTRGALEQWRTDHRARLRLLVAQGARSGQRLGIRLHSVRPEERRGGESRRNAPRVPRRVRRR